MEPTDEKPKDAAIAGSAVFRKKGGSNRGNVRKRETEEGEEVSIRSVLIYLALL